MALMISSVLSKEGAAGLVVSSVAFSVADDEFCVLFPQAVMENVIAAQSSSATIFLIIDNPLSVSFVLVYPYYT